MIYLVQYTSIFSLFNEIKLCRMEEGKYKFLKRFFLKKISTITISLREYIIQSNLRILWIFLSYKRTCKEVSNYLQNDRSLSTELLYKGFYNNLK